MKHISGSLLSFLAFVTLFLCSWQAVYADGIIFPRPIDNPNIIIIRPPQPDLNFTVPLSITRHRVHVDISDIAASTKIDQAFYNHENRVVEGLYIFPLPPGASISGFEMDIDGKMTKGELIEADKARSIYENIVRQMRDPGLLEFMGTGLFKTRIYPIEPMKNKNVKIEYQEALRSEGNLIRYVYPLNIERFTKEPMKDVSIEIKLKAKTPITTIYSPTHSVDIKRNGDHEATIGFEADSLRPDKDFVLYYTLSQKDLSMSFLANRPDASEDGSFMIMLAPRSELQRSTVSAIDAALVLDTSGSMAGPKMDQARKALQFCVNALKKGDRFNIITFSTEVDSYKNELVELDDKTKEGALEYIKRMEPIGGTNISEALTKAIRQLKEKKSDRPSFIVFVTDGKPTAGLTEPEEILREVKNINDAKVRIFTFGVGDQLNAPLLDRLAEEYGGASDYVSESEDIEAKISGLFSKLTHPVMTDVSLTFKNVDVSQLYPQRIPDIFKGSTVTVLGRYRNAGEALVTLSGSIDGKPVKFDYEVSFPEKETENGFVSRIWATRKIGFLLDQIRKNGADDELKNEIVTLAQRYGIITPYTSYLVAEDKDIPGPRISRAVVPYIGGGLKESRAKFEAFSTSQDGAEAVAGSRAMNELKSASVPTPSVSASFHQGTKGSFVGAQPPKIKEVADRTFYLIDGKWVDGSVKSEQPELKIKAYSAAYFELAKKYPAISKFMALGDKLIFRVENKTIEISDSEGIEEIDKLGI